MAAVIRNNALFCLNCGKSEPLIFPLPTNKFNELATNFEKVHKSCEKTWTEPTADPTKTVYQRAMWWINNGERGLSSETMFACFMSKKLKQEKPFLKINHPHDPDDFKRCYKLLEAIPEWKKELFKLKELSNEWKNLVENWDTLTGMFEQNVREEWKNADKIGMYELMQQLTCLPQSM